MTKYERTNRAFSELLADSRTNNKSNVQRRRRPEDGTLHLNEPGI